ncbi:MAG: DUF6940 family protein [Panacagrimonas sp.]
MTFRSPVPGAAWQWRTQVHPNRGLIAASILRAGSPVSFQQVLARWTDSAEFRAFWVRCLRRVPFEACCWELPPLTSAVLSRDFECVFVEDRELAQTWTDRKAFAGPFAQAAPSDFAVFDNLGGDASLIAPCPRGEANAYTHLARFVRHAPVDQVEGIWQALAQVAAGRIGEAPLWLSTAGRGVSWLHLRLDSTPKYYRHQPYATARFWPESLS